MSDKDSRDTDKKFRLRISPKRYNDFLLIAILVVLLMAAEFTLFFYNDIYSFSVSGVLNDAAVFLAVFMMLSLIRKPLLKKTLVTVVFIFFILLFVIDIFYSRIFSNFSSVSSIISVNNIFKQDISMIGFAPPSLLIAAIAAIGCFFINIIKLPPVRGKSFFMIILPVIVSIVVAVTSVNVSVMKKFESETYESKIEYYASTKFLYDSFYSGKKYASKFGYVNFRIKDLLMLKPTEEKEDLDSLALLFEGKENKAVNAFTGILKNQNIITIMAETLDTRVINPILTPNLYKFMSDSFTFENYYTPVFFEGATINSEFMSQMGMIPVTSKIWANNFGNQYNNNYFGEYSLAAQLGKNGYDTYYFHNFYRDFYFRNTMIPNWGFEKMGFGEDIVARGYPNFVKDTGLISFFEDDTIDYNSKFYAHITTYSMHGGDDQNYEDNMDFVRAYFPDVSRETAVYYTKAVVFDAFIGLLLDELAEKGVLDDTAILIYPDHYNYGTPQFYQDIGVSMNNKELHRQTPMLLLQGEKTLEFEGILGGKKINNVGSTIDIAPTLLNLAAPDSVYKYFEGEDIFDAKSIVFFQDLTVYNGRSFLNIELNLDGDESDRNELQIILENKISLCQMLPKIYDMDYFLMIKLIS